MVGEVGIWRGMKLVVVVQNKAIVAFRRDAFFRHLPLEGHKHLAGFLAGLRGVPAPSWHGAQPLPPFPYTHRHTCGASYPGRTAVAH